MNLVLPGDNDSETCFRWLRRYCSVLPPLEPRQFEAAGEPPPPSVHRRMEKIRRIVVHHSATATGCARVFRAMHRAVNGWLDLGYHYVIGNGTLSGDGQVESGRPEWAVGAHSRKNNEDSIGVCLVGNFDDAPPTDHQLEALSGLLARLIDRYSLTPDNIFLHRELPECRTGCPGRYFDRRALENLS